MTPSASMACPNRDSFYGEWICTCRHDVPDHQLREVLSRFINGWIGEMGHSQAKYLASQPSATPSQMRKLLAELEAGANHAYGMWRQTL